MRGFEYYQLIVGVEDGLDVIYYEGEVLPLAQYMSPVLDHLGEHGWELITSESMIDTEIIRQGEDTISRTATSVITYLFKRDADPSTPPPESIYPEEIQRLRQIDAGAARKFDEELVAKKTVMPTISGTATAIDDDTPTTDIGVLKETYSKMGYLLLSDFPTRVIFSKGIEEIRYDKEPVSGLWVKR